jgi:hypothetical protein
MFDEIQVDFFLFGVAESVCVVTFVAECFNKFDDEHFFEEAFVCFEDIVNVYFIVDNSFSKTLVICNHME